MSILRVILGHLQECFNTTLQTTGAKTSSQRTRSATLFKHFLPQKYSPLSTPIERGIIARGRDLHLQETTIYDNDFEENAGLLLILIFDFKGSRWSPFCQSALILESLYSSLATAINPRPCLLDFVELQNVLLNPFMNYATPTKTGLISKTRRIWWTFKTVKCERVMRRMLFQRCSKRDWLIYSLLSW